MFSRVLVRKIFCKSLWKHLRGSLFLVKLHVLNTFFWIPLDEYIKVWKLFFERRLCKTLHCKNFRWKYIKNISLRSYLRNKIKKANFLIALFPLEVRFLDVQLSVQVKSMSQICAILYYLLNCKSKINKLFHSLEELIQQRQNSLLPQGQCIFLKVCS